MNFVVTITPAAWIAGAWATVVATLATVMAAFRGTDFPDLPDVG